ncbi:MAG: hypothetical protein U0794_20265 [Isosphaeraceae bacterium]
MALLWGSTMAAASLPARRLSATLNLWMLLTAPILAWTDQARAADSEPGWVNLSSLDAWKGATTTWMPVGNVALKPKEPNRLVADPGDSAFYNGPSGRART